MRVSKVLISSYVLDWLVILVVAGGGGFLYRTTGTHRAFSLDDGSISYPFASDTVSITVVGVVAFLVPAIVIAVFSLLLPTANAVAPGKHATQSDVWHRRLWEWNVGWLGLALSLAGAFFVTAGLKDVVGKPRPDLIARCDPDLSAIAAHMVGGLGSGFEEAPVLVDISICRNHDLSVLHDGFAAFPSGHASFSWAGLLYLSLWLSAKFAVGLPNPLFANAGLGRLGGRVPERAREAVDLRSLAAAPPLHLLVVVAAPVVVAMYICATRFADYMHAGWDITAGSLIGAFFGWLGFRWFHIPAHFSGPNGSGGWSWGPRSRQRAIYAGFGRPGYIEEAGLDDGWRSGYNDVELGHVRVTNPA